MLVFGIISLLPARAFFMLKFYILISSGVGSIWRHFSKNYSNLDRSNTEVVINTKYPKDEQDLVQFCKDFNITYHVTESNGTPARGKNELLKIFLNSDAEYCVQIDGDDYLTPHGVWLYQHIASLKNVPDAICLKNQISICVEGKMLVSDKIGYRKFFTVPADSVQYDAMYNNMIDRNITEEDAERYVEYHKTYYNKQQIYCEQDEAHSRVVFMSKKAAQHSFPEDFVVGEDTLQYFRLKHEHMQGNLVFVCNDEAPATYIYNQVDSMGAGTVWKHTQGFTDWSWMGKFNDQVKILEEKGELYDKDLPLLKINYPENFEVDDYDTAGTLRYASETHYVDMPANAAKINVIEHLKKYGKSLEK